MGVGPAEVGEAALDAAAQGWNQPQVFHSGVWSDPRWLRTDV